MDLDWLIDGSELHRVEQLEGNTIRISPAEPSNECAKKFLQVVERVETQLGPGAIKMKYSSSRNPLGLDSVEIELPDGTLN
jgi:hypothetical protein